MSPPRPRRSTAQLIEAYDGTLDALRRSFEQLEYAVALFHPDLDVQAFATAWGSDDPSERNRAAGVLANFEKTYMLLMDLITLSVKIASRLGAHEADEQTSAIACLREEEVISQETQDALDDQRKVRNASQHVYVELSISALRDAVHTQLKTTPAAIRAIGAWVSTFEGVQEERQGLRPRAARSKKAG